MIIKSIQGSTIPLFSFTLKSEKSLDQVNEVMP